MTRRLLVINPNSNDEVTESIAQSLDAEGAFAGLGMDFVTLRDAPFGIESDADIDAASALVVSAVTERADRYDAFVIACYSDPGLSESRAAVDRPVFGIHESAVGLSAAHQKRFGVLALSRESIQRHIAYVRSLGLHEFHAGERPLDVSVAEGLEPGTFDKILATGQELIAEDGAETLILGCAGLGGHARGAARALHVPVIDPVYAAVSMAAENLASGARN